MLTIILISLGILSRLVSHTEQFTAILAVSFCAGLYLKGPRVILVPLGMMMVTDAIIGFHDTMFFTWGSIVLISLLGLWLKEKKSLGTVLGGSFVSALIFFVVTNFGAWLSLYPHDMAGLRQCYIMAIPFFRSTLVSTVAFSMVFYLAYEWALKRSQGTSLARLF